MWEQFKIIALTSHPSSSPCNTLKLTPTPVLPKDSGNWGEIRNEELGNKVSDVSTSDQSREWGLFWPTLKRLVVLKPMVANDLGSRDPCLPLCHMHLILLLSIPLPQWILATCQPTLALRRKNQLAPVPVPSLGWGWEMRQDKDLRLPRTQQKGPRV